MRGVAWLCGVAVLGGLGLVAHGRVGDLARARAWPVAATWASLLGLVFAAGLVARLLWRDWRGPRRLLGYRPRDLDRLSGAGFERWTEAMLRRAGFAVERTARTRDYGIDLIATGAGKRIGIEVKRREARISNAVIRSVVGGCQYHRCDVAAVVTQSEFTADARRQAAASELPVLLIDRAALPELGRRLWAACG